MKNYVVKIGILYIQEFKLHSRNVETSFIDKLILCQDLQDVSFRVSKDEQEKLREILKSVLGLENEYSEIQFLEIEDSSD